MTHSMQLTPSPFQMIKEGTKTIELRLFDEKRRKIQIGDIIEFSNTETGEKIGAKVSALYVFDSFELLYKELSLLECGYTEADIETASPDDMNVYARLLSKQIFVPVETEDKELMYSPFQCMAQYFLSLGYAGIIYSSTVFSEGKNVVLFDKDAATPMGKIKKINV